MYRKRGRRRFPPFRRQFVNKNDRHKWRNKKRSWKAPSGSLRRDWWLCDRFTSNRSHIKQKLHVWIRTQDEDIIFPDDVRKYTGWYM